MLPAPFLASALLAVLCGAAAAGRDEAETCVREQVSNAYPEGWGVRTVHRVDLGEGEIRTWLLTLYAGVEYRVTGCGDPSVLDLDLFLYDAAGQPRAQDVTRGRSGELTFRPPTTDTYFLSVRVASRTPPPAGRPGAPPASVATAVMYR